MPYCPGCGERVTCIARKTVIIPASHYNLEYDACEGCNRVYLTEKYAADHRVTSRVLDEEEVEVLLGQLDEMDERAPEAEAVLGRILAGDAA